MTLELRELRLVGVRELDLLIDRFASLGDGDWERRTRCQGWAILDLGRHISNEPLLYGEALLRLAQGVTEPGDKPPEGVDPGGIVTMLREGRAVLDDAMSQLTEESLNRVAPYPFRRQGLPGEVAVQAPAWEFGIHRNDLEWAIGDEAPLPHDVVRVISPLVRWLMPFYAARSAERPAGSTAYRLKGEVFDMRLAYQDGSWGAATADTEECVIAGGDSAVLLFVHGRIPWNHPSLEIGGRKSLAADFKRFFPGP